MIFGPWLGGALFWRDGVARAAAPAAHPGSIDLTTAPVISVIDDDESVRTAIKNLLMSLGYIAHVFPSAEAFLQSTQLHHTWCVIADVRMPGMSGIDLQSRLRNGGNRVPFVFITAVPDETVRARAIEDGALCFLTKPFDEDTLIGCLDAAVKHDRGGTAR